MKICVLHEELFANVFERKTEKYCNLFKLHRCKIKSQLLVSLQLAENPILKGYGILTGTVKLLEKKTLARI